MENPNFIGVYDDALSSIECDKLISFFESSSKRRGGVWNGNKMQIDNRIKKNIEVNVAKVSTTPLIAKSLEKCCKKYCEEYFSINNIPKWSLLDDYTFQKLESEDDGYKQWHTEHGPGKTSHRILAWMFYLNDASGTEFMHFPTVDAIMGRCVIWPSAFTHMHRSAPNRGLKYIMSGWFSFI
jgi:hypothetical protein